LPPCMSKTSWCKEYCIEFAISPNIKPCLILRVS
jgi:hypothetical protein